MMTNIEQLLQLIKDNPDLPVVPVVDSEVVEDDYDRYWFGKWGQSEVTEYYSGRKHTYFKDDDIEDILRDLDGCKCCCDPQGRDIYNLSDDEWKRLYESLPWVKCIAVYITT